MCKKKMNVVQKEGVSDNSLQAFCDASNLIELEASTHRNGRQGAYLWCCVRTTQGAPAPRAHALLPHDPGRERRRLCAGSCAHVQRLGAGPASRGCAARPAHGTWISGGCTASRHYCPWSSLPAPSCILATTCILPSFDGWEWQPSHAYYAGQTGALQATPYSGNKTPSNSGKGAAHREGGRSIHCWVTHNFGGPGRSGCRLLTQTQGTSAVAAAQRCLPPAPPSAPTAPPACARAPLPPSGSGSASPARPPARGRVPPPPEQPATGSRLQPPCLNPLL